MSSNVVNPTAYLRTSREFPEDLHQFTVQANKAFVDTANAINSCTCSIFPTNIPAITKEQWFIMANQKQQGFRQVFIVQSTASINHGINVVDPNQFTDKCAGSYTDGTNCYGLIFGSTVAIPGQISFYITSAQIVFVVDGAAPALTAGKITLEWLSQV